MRTIAAVELAKTGTYRLLSGPHTFTREQLVRAAAVSSSGLPPRVKVGHLDPRFDGEPALGSVRNVRVSADGSTLLGDLVDVPDWLAEALPARFPGRSIEAVFGGGDDLRLTAVALLGVTAPAIESLADLRRFVADDPELLVASGADNSGRPVLLMASAPPTNPKEHNVPTDDDILDGAVAAGKITTKDRAAWASRLASDPAGARHWIAKLAPGVVRASGSVAASAAGRVAPLDAAFDETLDSILPLSEGAVRAAAAPRVEVAMHDHMTQGTVPLSPPVTRSGVTAADVEAEPFLTPEEQYAWGAFEGRIRPNPLGDGTVARDAEGYTVTVRDFAPRGRHHVEGVRR